MASRQCGQAIGSFRALQEATDALAMGLASLKRTLEGVNLQLEAARVQSGALTKPLVTHSGSSPPYTVESSLDRLAWHAL